MKVDFLLLLLLTVRLSAQLPDLDTLSREVDLSTLKPREVPSEPVETAPPSPHTHLFAGIEALTPLSEPGEDSLQPIGDGKLQILHLPAADYLVVPNPPRIDSAYHLLAETLAEMDISSGFPLKVVLHADSKFSVAIVLTQKKHDSLPLGVDISPLPPITLLGLDADIELLQRDHPPFLEAFQSIRSYARSVGFDLDTREFYALPREPGRVFFGLRINNPTRTGDLPVQP